MPRPGTRPNEQGFIRTGVFGAVPSGMSGLERSLGLPALTYYGVGTIIGAGIYSVIGVAAGEVGESLWQPFLLASVVAALTALSYAELVAAIPKVGGEYAFLHRASGGRRSVSFIGGFVVVLAGAATAATVAIAFAGYLDRFVGIPQWISALLLLGVCTGINIAGIRQSTWANMVLTSIQVLGLLIVIGAGISVGNIAEPLTARPEAGIFVATALIFFVYTGFEGMVNLAEESKRPEKDLPRAILLSIAITTVVYLFVALAVVTLADPEQLGESDAPLSLAAGKAHDSLATALAWFALCATATTALITFITISRLLLGMARDGNMPRPLTKLLPGRRSPWVAALVMFAGAAAMIPLGDVETVASVASLTTLAAFVAVNVCLIVLRRNEPDLERPFRVPWSVRGYPVPTVLAILTAIALGTRFEPVVYAIGGGAFALAGLIYVVWARNLPAETKDK
jgi:amino acid transporter